MDYLKVKRIQCVIGGSMGGMMALEWALIYKDFVRSIVPIATAGRQSAWCIGWSHAQRQCILMDPNHLVAFIHIH